MKNIPLVAMMIGFLLLAVGCGKTQTASVSFTPAPQLQTVPQTETETEIAPTVDNWKIAHRELLEKIRVKNPDLQFTLLYVDEDNIPEVCVFGDNQFDIFGYDEFYQRLARKPSPLRRGMNCVHPLDRLPKI